MSEKSKPQIAAPPSDEKLEAKTLPDASSSETEETQSIEKLTKELDQTGHEIQLLRNELNLRFSEIATLTKLLLDKDDENAANQKRIAQEIESRYLDEVNKKNSYVAELENSLQIKDSQINFNKSALQEKDTILERLQCIINISEKNINALNDELVSSRRINEDLAKQFNEANIVSNKALSDLEAVNGLLATLTNEKNEKMKQIDILTRASLAKQSEIDALKTHINAIHNSTSWKVTRPLRFIKKLIRFF